MADPSGTFVKAAIRRPAETSLFSETATFGTNQIPILSESIVAEPEIDTEQAVAGSAAQQQSDVVGWNVGGVISTELWYEGLEPLLLAAAGFEQPTVYTGVLGSGSGGSPAPSGDGAYMHIFELDDKLHRVGWEAGERAASSGGSTDPTYWTTSDQKVRTLDLAVYKGMPASYVHAFYGGAVKKATFKIAPGGMAVDWEMMFRRHERALASGLNFSSWALPTARKRCLFPETRLYLGAVGAAEGDSQAFADAEFYIDNTLDSEKEGGDSALYIQEPIRTGTRKVAGRIKLARYRSEQFETWRDAETELQMRIAVTSTTVISGSAQYWEMSFILPTIKITKAEHPIGGPGLITGDVEFEAFRPASEEAWLTTLLGGISQVKDNEMIIRIVGTMPACYSRDRQASGVSLP